MEDETQSIAIRALQSISVLVDDVEIAISLAKKENEDVDSFLDDRQQKFVRKVEARGTGRFYCVPGVRAVQDDTAEDVFTHVVYVPYQKGWVWTLPVTGEHGDIGIFRMVAPTTGQPQARSSNTTSKRTTRESRAAPKVRPST